MKHEIKTKILIYSDEKKLFFYFLIQTFIEGKPAETEELGEKPPSLTITNTNEKKYTHKKSN